VFAGHKVLMVVDLNFNCYGKDLITNIKWASETMIQQNNLPSLLLVKLILSESNNSAQLGI
jgi:hypothetical protein